MGCAEASFWLESEEEELLMKALNAREAARQEAMKLAKITP